MRALRLVTSAARRLDHAIGRWSGIARVLVDVRTPMNLAVLRPMWRRLQCDPRITLSFTAEDTEGVGAALERDRLRQALVPREQVLWRRFDLVMTADVWNHAPVQRHRRRICFFHGVAGKYDLDDPARLAGARLSSLDRLAFINAERLRRYVEAGVVSPGQAVLVGFPKSDDLVNGLWSASTVRRSLGLEPSKTTIIYAPTFSTASSLTSAGESIIETLLATGSNVIVKLHDRSMVPSAKHTARMDWPARLARFASPRFALARGDDAGPFLAAADLLVTDHSTVGFEFALIDRPIVVFDTPPLKQAARIDADKWELLRSMADVVRDGRELRSACERSLAEPARGREARKRARELFAFPGAATGRALAVIYELLDLGVANEILHRHRYA